MKRRTFINISTKTSILLLFPVLACNTSNQNRLLYEKSPLSRIFTIDMMKRIGLKYQEQFPLESNEKTLYELLLEPKFNRVESKGSSISFESISSTELSLKNSIKDDYLANNLIIIDGWILSRTEARQCALYEIINK